MILRKSEFVQAFPHRRAELAQGARAKMWRDTAGIYRNGKSPPIHNALIPDPDLRSGYQFAMMDPLASVFREAVHPVSFAGP